jgi:hypothetical protein
MTENINSQLKDMANFKSNLIRNTQLPSTLNIIQVGGCSLPNSTMFVELVNAPRLDLILLGRFLMTYDMDDSTRKNIGEIFIKGQTDSLWSDIMKIIKRDLNNQESKLLYIFFSLQKYRFPQSSIDLESTRILIEKSNRTIAKIDNRIKNPSEADKILKTFLDNRGVAWEEYLYNSLATTYLEIMQPMPLGILNNINHDYTINSIGPSLAEKEREINALKLDIRKIEALSKEQGNENRSMEFSFQIEALNRKVIALKADLSFRQPQLNSYVYRIKETINRLLIFSTEFYHLLYYDKILSSLLHKECPEYFTALPDQYRERINQKNIKRQIDEREELYIFCQCQFCYRYKFEQLPRNGEYSWHCKRDECKKRYKAWTKHLNGLTPNPVNLSQVFG